MLVKVTKDNVFVEDKYNIKIHSGEYKVNKLSFEFSEEYTDDLTIKALFTVGENFYETPIINNECYIPSKALTSENYVTLGVYAYKIVNNKVDLRYSPLPTYFRVLEGSYKPNAQDSEELTPTQFEQYMSALNDGLNQVQNSIGKLDKATSNANKLVDEINQKLANGEFNGRDGKDGKDGPQGPKGEPGEAVGLDDFIPKQNITDSIISVDDALEYKVFEFGVDGKHEQNTTTGKNKFNGVVTSKKYAHSLDGEMKTSDNWSVTDFIEIIGDTTYTYSGIINGNSPIAGTCFYNENKQFISSITPIDYTFTTPSNARYVVISLNSETPSNIQLELGITATEYEPYTGGIPSPNPEYPQVIKTFSGVNIYNIDEFPLELGNFNYISGGNYDDDTSVRSKELFPIDDSYSKLYFYMPNTTSENKVACIFYDKNKARVEEGKEQWLTTNKVNFAIPKGAKYCKFRISNWNNLTPEIVLSYSDINSYLPYNTIKIKKASKNQAYTGWADEFAVKVNNSKFASLEVKDNRNCLKFSPYANKTGGLLDLKYKENTQYTFKFDFFISAGGNSNVSIFYTDGSRDPVPYNKPNIGAWVNRKITSAKNKTVERIDVHWVDTTDNYIDLDTFMIYEGTDDLPYEPYQEKTYQIDLKGNEMLSLDDLIIDKNGNVSLIKKWAKSNIVLNGDFFDSSYGLRWYWFSKPTNSKDYGTFLTNAICTVAQAKPNEGLPIFFGGNGNHNKYAIVYDTTRIDPITFEELKALVDGAVYYYQLAEPEIIDLGKIEPIETFEGSNTFTVIGSLDTQANMTYALDMKKYTDKKIEELKSTIVSANV